MVKVDIPIPCQGYGNVRHMRQQVPISEFISIRTAHHPHPHSQSTYDHPFTTASKEDAPQIINFEGGITNTETRDLALTTNGGLGYSTTDGFLDFLEGPLKSDSTYVVSIAKEPINY